MAEIKFDINKAFREVFGVYSRVPLFPFANAPKEAANAMADYPDAQTIEERENNRDDYSMYGNMHGQLLQDRFSFGHPDIPKIRGEFINNAGKYMMSPYTVLEITRAKNIVKTPLQGRNGTVKEFISMDDWHLHFKGFIINPNSNELPHELTAKMLSVFEINRHLTFNSEAFRRWAEMRMKVPTEDAACSVIVIDDVKLPAMDGFENVQPFEIMAVSDNPVEIQLLMQNA